MVFSKIFSPKSIIVNLESEDKDELFEEMVQVIHSEHPEVGRMMRCLFFMHVKLR